MKQYAVVSIYGVEGSSALKPQSTRFVVIEGTKDSERREEVQDASEKLSVKNVVFAYVALIALVAVLAATYAFVDVSIASRLTASVSEVPATSVYVRPGDSVWALAEEHPIDGYATSDVVRWIEEANDLQTSTLIPGQELLVPAASSGVSQA